MSNPGENDLVTRLLDGIGSYSDQGIVGTQAGLIREAAAKLTAADARIVAYASENARLKGIAQEAEAERAAAEARLSEALKALEPFATDADIYDNQDIDDGEKSFCDNITVGDIRRARAALRATGRDKR